MRKFRNGLEKALKFHLFVLPRVLTGNSSRKKLEKLDGLSFRPSPHQEIDWSAIEVVRRPLTQQQVMTDELEVMSDHGLCRV